VGAPESEKQQHALVKERKRGCDGGTLVESVVILNAAEGDEILCIHRYGLARPACTSPRYEPETVERAFRSPTDTYPQHGRHAGEHTTVL
jgi:hypothetical protein